MYDAHVIVIVLPNDFNNINRQIHSSGWPCTRLWSHSGSNV